MQMYKVYGFQHKVLNFNDQQIPGTFLYVGCEAPGVTGVQMERVFLSDNKAQGYSPQLGDKVDIRYNRFGKVDSVCAVK